MAKKDHEVKLPRNPVTSRRIAFANAYLINGGNATQAAITAEYSKKTAYSQGQRLLKCVEIKKMLADAQSVVAARNDVTRDELVGYSRELIDRGLKPAPITDSDGEPTGEYRYDSSAVAKGIDLLAKLTGQYAPEKLDIGFSSLTDEQLRDKVLELQRTLGFIKK